MPKKRKFDMIRTKAEFKGYVSSKNPRARKMLEIFYEMLEGREPELLKWKDDSEIMLRDPKRMEITFNSQIKKLGIELKIRKYDRGHVSLDTGAVEIDDRGKLSPTEWGQTFNVYNLPGANGLEGAATELTRVAQIYRQIFGKRYKPPNST